VGIRIYLTGRLCVERRDSWLGERDFPGRQGRLAFAYLTLQRGRAVPRHELAEVLWPEGPPATWHTAISVVVSNLRLLLSRVGLPREGVLAFNAGCYQLRLPPDAWIDLTAARDALERAEAALRRDDATSAYGWAGVVTAIGRRELLAGETAPWLDRYRDELQRLFVRGLDCFADVMIRNGEPALAVAAAETALTQEPFHEAGYQLLLRAHAAAGNRAEALRTYERCRRLLAEELGTDPSAQTQAVYLQILTTP
jgi:DNA-binding SARP family transcriptional activator